ncbi:MAG: tRNA pseudouridine(38-40) synthase TruA [Candidatus Glassbacteria bacterium]|nr:tRNA pseudouridine(38-40) synthase TruA [Candidatus Glassbacteria bacterium]
MTASETGETPSADQTEQESRPKRRIRMTVSYDGTGYCGWQLQPDEMTVQGELETALSRILGEDIRLTGASRTDAGVHATGQVAHFDLTGRLAAVEIDRALNSILPEQIRVREVEQVPGDFHARYSARWKIYRYSLAEPDLPDAPLLARTHWLRNNAVDISLLGRCCELVQGRHGFFTFSKQEGHRENHDCEIFEARWSSGEGTLYFQLRGDRFLRGMVRMLVGGMLAVADGRADIGEFSAALNEPGRWKRAVPAPACGLTLVCVNYRDESEADPQSGTK